ncbi:MAG: YciI family protein [Actinomycetota bacterium]|nr:YciI family protein [Actinomycetota bacterium]
MTQYLLSVHGSDEEYAKIPPDEMQKMFDATERFNEKLRSEGAWVFGGGLMPVDQSTTVDNTGDKPIVTDGPYTESKEYLGGFWIIEAPDLDAALDWAKQGSQACAGKVEVRPFQSE